MKCVKCVKCVVVSIFTNSMIRRQARLRREFLYRKALEGKEREQFEKRRRLKQALAEGKPIPYELRAEARELQDANQANDNITGANTHTHVDDEYARAGLVDPKILVTTSREPSSRLSAFAKELRLIFPNSQRINRGRTVVKELVDVAKQHDFTDIIIVHEHRGEPDGLVVCHLPYGPTAYFGLRDVHLRHDITEEKLGTVSEQYPHLIFENFTTNLGSRMTTILKHLFPVPKTDSRRVLSFVNRNDTICFRHHTYKKLGNKDVELVEIGPRFEMVPFQIKLGSIDMTEAENEWVLRPYMNTAKKRKTF